jgi:hypothetical protein
MVDIVASRRLAVNLNLFQGPIRVKLGRSTGGGQLSPPSESGTFTSEAAALPLHQTVRILSDSFTPHDIGLLLRKASLCFFWKFP